MLALGLKMILGTHNTNQSMQTAIYVIRENRSNTVFVDMSDVRTIQMVRDHFWP